MGGKPETSLEGTGNWCKYWCLNIVCLKLNHKYLCDFVIHSDSVKNISQVILSKESKCWFCFKSDISKAFLELPKRNKQIKYKFCASLSSIPNICRNFIMNFD